MSLPASVKQGVAELLEKKYCKEVILLEFQALGGGCISLGGKVKTSEGDFFVKWNDAMKFPGMFEAEANGLNLLRQAQAIDIPEVIDNNVVDRLQFIVLEFIGSQHRSKNFWKTLGSDLALLHRQTHFMAGLDHNNYMGSLPQFNTLNESWVNFFIEQRLQVQVKLAVNSGLLEASIIDTFESLYKKLPDFFPTEKPSLLHGDLWNGNLLVNEKGEPCLIDPATYYGHREVDLAMTQLFGGFDDEFYETYMETFPLQPGYQKRFDIYNLYPLLVHVNLFGGSYLSQVNHILKEFS